MTERPAPIVWLRTDGTPVLQAQLRSDGAQCLATAHQAAAPRSGPVINNTVVVEADRPGEAAFIDSLPATARGRGAGDPDTLEIVMNGCMAKRGYIRR